MPIGSRNPTPAPAHSGLPATLHGLAATPGDPGGFGASPCGCSEERFVRTITGVLTTLDDGSVAAVATLPAPAGGRSYELERITVQLDHTDVTGVLVTVGAVTSIADRIPAPTTDVYVSADAKPIWVAETEPVYVVWVGASVAGPCRARLQVRVI